MVKNTFEMMKYYELNCRSRSLKIKFIKYWILYSTVYSTPLSNFILKFQKILAGKIGKGFV
jgi:hypothetical protein